MSNANRLLAHERTAIELASMLHPMVLAPMTLLCLDLRCRPAAIRRAARELTDHGVHVTHTPDGLLADRDTWEACQFVGLAE